MHLRTLAVAYFRKEDWPRWLAIDPDFEPDHASWLKRVEKALADYSDPGYVLEKVMVDPDEFLEWSRVNGGKVDTQARGAFAAIVLAEKYGTDH